MISMNYSLLLISALLAGGGWAFLHVPKPARQSPTRLWMAQDLSEVRSFIQENYPSCHSLVHENDDLWKKLNDGYGFTIFVPNEQAFEQLGAKKQEQLKDVRNTETTHKIGAFHCIGETVAWDDLYNAGGVITMGGDVMVDRSRSGGMFGVGGEEDGGVVVNGARVTQSFELGPGVVYEVDKLINPNILWRYMDQLRIPGST